MSDLIRQRRAVRRIGHKGADHIAPGNTAASFDAALAHGCDMVEFDVLPERTDGSGRLVLAHDFKALARREPLTLEEGLDHLRSDAFAGIEIDVDLKLPGYEERVIAALRERGMEERTLISTMEVSSLPVIRAASSKVRLGWSVPKVRRNYLAHPATKGLALATVAVLRRTVPRAVARAMRAGEVDAVMSHFSLVTPHFVRTVRRAGGELYVWTVDDAASIRRFEAMGVTGVITNDPRLFDPA
ncbi:MAG TPA: glycerophosphodiester phosphodiesterase [Baekduia sp.]|uniref:glycerophosphodiester phosphodiesterase n=1 Tax=Baekduia sp. TaxID=2600305 RepID=UPI002C0D08CA|nr:glycerophosphodiester phosphodiesterase [Baekduia sp.]HMJ32690.1 glycerophosphodiester phosphodiesterase [Baekduia sp.]